MLSGLFEQMEELEGLGFDDLWVTEHHFSEYGGTLPHPPTFLSAVARFSIPLITNLRIPVTSIIWGWCVP